MTRPPTTVGSVYNLGSDEEVTHPRAGGADRPQGNGERQSEIRLTRRTRQVYGQKFEDVPRRVPDLVAKCRAAVGFEREFDLDGIIDAVVADRRGAPGREPGRAPITAPRLTPKMPRGPLRGKITRGGRGPDRPPDPFTHADSPRPSLSPPQRRRNGLPRS